MTSGGGAAGFAENSYLDSQVFRLAYYYDDKGQPADRPQITDAPLNANAGQTVQSPSTTRPALPGSPW
ncbi:MAG: hypothetical protein AAGA70_03095 [Pseudomonadota bacterium]